MSARAWTAFAAVSILWGIPYLFIKVAVDDGVPPIFLAWVRVLMAGAVLLVLSARAGVLKPALHPDHRRWFLLYAIVEICLPFPLLALRFDPSERATGTRAVGLAIGFAGVVALVGLDVSGSSEELLGALMILL